MKLEHFITNGQPGSHGERMFTTEAMSLLDTYLAKNPMINDIRMLMNDDIACDKFRRWSIVRKNCKDICGRLGTAHTDMKIGVRAVANMKCDHICCDRLSTVLTAICEQKH
jgi:hypothetical protein